MKLYKNHRLVKGSKRSILYNSDYSSYSFVNSIVSNERDKLLDSFDFDVVEHKKKWSSPSIITNSIISVTEQNGLVEKENFEVLLKMLQTLICKHIVLFFPTFTKISKIKCLISVLSSYNIHSVQIICKYNKKYYTDNFGNLIMSIGINKNLIVFNSPFNESFENTMFFVKKSKIFSTTKNKNEFSPNIFLLNEALNHNTYFNRKLFIDKIGLIKNSPQSLESFGLIQKVKNVTDLKDIINNKKFKKYWNIHKDICLVCKDCEYRYMCVDNRIPYKNKSNQWEYKEPCNYNPYLGIWDNE